MLENFQLAIIAKSGGQTRLLNIPLHQALQSALATSWLTQYEAFVKGIQEIAFNAGYTPEAHERFQLVDYELPVWLCNENSRTVQHLDPINQNEALIDSAQGIVAFARNAQGEELMLFQNFSRSHVIRPERFLFLQNNTYESVRRPGLTLDNKLSALYLAAQNKLLFHNFRITNTFLPLEDFVEEATEQGIRDVLSHARLASEDTEALAVDANQWFRKRFAMLNTSGLLDKYTAQQISARSNGYEVDVQLDGDKIVFPADKVQAKRLLQFLNEEIFRGPITETLFETNSKREAD
ncbi:MAG: hypothetical protein ACYCSZ_06695 [Burkholderiales bacterium]